MFPFYRFEETLAIDLAEEKRMFSSSPPFLIRKEFMQISSHIALFFEVVAERSHIISDIEELHLQLLLSDQKADVITIIGSEEAHEGTVLSCRFFDI
jgi:hypothetical protein